MYGYVRVPARLPTPLPTLSTPAPLINIFMRKKVEPVEIEPIWKPWFGTVSQPIFCEPSADMMFWNEVSFSGNEFAWSREKSTESCMKRCIQNYNCNAYSYDTLNRPNSQKNANCWLKTDAQGINENAPGYTSGIRCSTIPLEQPERDADGEYPLDGFPCPSTDCWTYNDALGCQIKDSSDKCNYSHSCGATEFVIHFPYQLFGSLRNRITNFDDQSCLVKSKNGYTWRSDLGGCGQRIAKNGGHINFAKVLRISNAKQIEFDDIETKSDNYHTTVTFTCSYSATATATTGVMEPGPEKGQQMSLFKSATFDAGLTLNFYDHQFQIIKNTSSKMKSILYPMITWSVESLVEKVGFYISNCKVEDVSSGTGAGLSIVNKSCYAKVIGAQPVGDKFVSRVAKFKYHSFSYSKSATPDLQKLICTVTFCVINNGVRYDYTILLNIAITIIY